MMNAIERGKALQNKQGAWFFSRLEPSGTVVVQSPAGETYTVKHGELYGQEGQRLLNDMIAALSLRPDDNTCTRCGQTGHRASHCPWPVLGDNACLEDLAAAGVTLMGRRPDHA